LSPGVRYNQKVREFPGQQPPAQEGDGVLIQKHRQEAVSRAYVHAVAARCGLSCSFRDFDYGIDLTLHAIRRIDKRYVESGFALDVQAKTNTAPVITSSHVHYDMEVKTYEDLRDPSVGCPRILVLLVLPAEESAWTEQTEEHLLLRKCAYWLSLKGMPATANSASIRVPIPRANVFSVDGLARLMEKVRKREEL